MFNVTVIRIKDVLRYLLTFSLIVLFIYIINKTLKNNENDFSVNIGKNIEAKIAGYSAQLININLPQLEYTNKLENKSINKNSILEDEYLTEEAELRDNNLMSYLLNLELGMNKFEPKGRKSLPTVLLNFGKNLVYSEGTKTEPYYVENIKNCIAENFLINPNNIDIIPVNKEKKSYNTIYLVEYAINDVNKRIKNGEIIDNVWVFFDKDSFTGYEKAFKKIDELNDSEKTNNNCFKYNKKTNVSWHNCWSNEAFELWLCLYFNYDQASHSRDDYEDKLNNYPALKKVNFDYAKNKKNIHTILTEAGGDIEKAIKFAKKLNKLNGRGNPSTGVYKFAEFFLPYMKK